MSGAAVWLVAGGCLFALAVLVDFVARASRSRADRLAFLALAAGSALVAVGGGFIVSGAKATIDLSWIDLTATPRVTVDPLSGLFLAITFGVAAAGALHAAGGPVRRQLHGGWGEPEPRGLPSLVALLLAGVLLVETAAQVYLFVLGWELVTLAFYLMTVFDRDRVGGWRRQAGVLAGVFGKASGAAVLLGFLLLAASSGATALGGLSAATGLARGVGYALLLLGFAIKVGMVPVHVWLPRSYSAAPAAARPLMAGAAVNIGFYGLWRTLAVLGAPPIGVALVFVAAAAVSALLGIAHVSVQDDLRRVIAYSSVENAGLIGVGFGTALVGAVTAEPRLIALGLLAATLQVIAHAVAKTLAFVTAGTVSHRLDSDDLEHLRGVARQLPWSSGGFLVAALTLAGLPLTIGFVSEWYLLQALLQEFRVDSVVARLVLASAGALVALTAGFAGFAFVRLVGLFLFGPRGSRRDLVDVRAVGRAAIVVLGAASLALAAFAPWTVQAIARGLGPVVGVGVTEQARVSPLVLQPVFSGFSILSPSWLWIVLPLMGVLAVLVVLGLSGRRLLAVRTVPSWRSATAEEATTSYTPYGFANPARRVLGNVLHTRSTLERQTEEPAPSVGQSRAVYSSDVVEVVEEYLYRPLEMPMRWLVTAARRLQSGRLDSYLTYMLIALLAVLALVAALA